jgi:hypothetical protein
VVIDIKDLKDTHKGERCFIVGNGPSLNKAPFDKLMSEHTFVVNRIALMFDKTDWRPTYYVHTTNQYDTPILTLKDFEMVMDVVKIGFIREDFRDKPLIQRYSNVCYIPITHGEKYGPDDGDNDWWSDDCSVGVCKFGTSILGSMQLAVYMGYTQLYLIGCDGWAGAFSHGKNDRNHFAENYHLQCAEIKATLNNAMFKRAHEIALANCKRLGVGIYDATQAPGLGALPKVDLLEVLK